MNKRILAFVLCLLMVVSVLPIQALATETGTEPVTEAVTEPVTEPATEAVTEPVTEPATEAVTEPITEPVTEPGTEPVSEEEEMIPLDVSGYEFAMQDDGTDSEALFTQYAQQVITGTYSESRELAMGSMGRQKLSGNDLLTYDALSKFFKDVANGKRASTVVTIGSTNDSAYKATFNSDKFPNMSKVYTALLTDLVYEQYWHDKTMGVGIESAYVYKSTGYIAEITFFFYTAGHVRGNELKVNTAITGAPQKALTNAKKIVDANASKGDYEKLVAYRDAICALTEYNFDAIEWDWDYNKNNNPWQLIYVFDGNTSTNVVCEGYSKAFNYLCDLSTFTNDVKCTLVDGTAFGGGAHMWNHVSFNGKNYLVDVTNVDVGSYGNNLLFMKGGKGSPTTQYIVSGYDFVFSEDSRELFGTNSGSVLNLSSTDFDPASVPGFTRLYGANRYQTSFEIADELKAVMGVSKFKSVIVTSGRDFADALCGSHLAAVKGAPILLSNGVNFTDLKSYIQKNLTSGGTVYILGGVNAVPQALETELAGYKIKRLAGANRYETNLAILKETGARSQVIVCTGRDFADSLSASATGNPILLVHDNLTAAQKAYLKTVTGNITILGGTNAVSKSMENQLKAYGNVTRISGANRYETSTKLAANFIKSPKQIVLAYGQDFPDGLCGGPLAYYLKCPLFLTANGRTSYAASYTDKYGIFRAYVLGGPTLVSDKLVTDILK